MERAVYRDQQGRTYSAPVVLHDGQWLMQTSEGLTAITLQFDDDRGGRLEFVGYRDEPDERLNIEPKQSGQSSESLAERLFPRGDAVGQHVRYSFWAEFQNLEIVGVAQDARIFDLRDAAPAVVYLSDLQLPREWGPSLNLYVRSKENPESLAKSIGQEIESLGHEYAIRTVTVDQMISRVLVNERVIAMLSGFFAVLALLLASIGLYGLMSYGVTRRTREIGVRVALGAQRESVRWMILRETLALTLFGIAIGIASGLAATSLIATMLFGLSPSDVSTIVTACLLLLAVAFVAGYLPARRASSIDPILALRTE